MKTSKRHLVTLAEDLFSRINITKANIQVFATNNNLTNKMYSRLVNVSNAIDDNEKTRKYTDLKTLIKQERL